MQRQINSVELNEFYNAIGGAVWHLQYLEHALVNFVVMKRHKRNPSDIDAAYERLEKERKGTLGSLYGRAKDEGIIPKELEQRFDKLIDERNWLIHHSRTKNSEDLYNDELRINVISRIDSIIVESMELTNNLLKLLYQFMQSEGVDIAEAERNAEKKLSELKGV
ncbi:MAG: hypothetical protein OEZ10_04020 [Gammaproteobacteria bacterium]|nr:hypothetical protein [Gammaproteobacteria bacterium]